MEIKDRVENGIAAYLAGFERSPFVKKSSGLVSVEGKSKLIGSWRPAR
ncbi:hypothetical protein FHT76_001802 [Rhizobium sp. BK176]|nr:hypothetical protein [Rhizobium sp. BK176]